MDNVYHKYIVFIVILIYVAIKYILWKINQETVYLSVLFVLSNHVHIDTIYKYRAYRAIGQYCLQLHVWQNDIISKYILSYYSPVKLDKTKTAVHSIDI